MTDTHPALNRTVTLRSPSGSPVARVGAMLPVAISIPAEVGLAVAGMVALAAQTVFVARLLMEPRSR